MDPIIDAYSPGQVAERVKQSGINKARLPTLQTLTLGILAGAFIAFGAMFYTVVITDSNLGFGPTRFLGGLAFSLGLVLVVIAGAELFTGNNLIVIAWAEHKISGGLLLRNWSLVFIANFIGALGSAGLMHLSGILETGNGAVSATAIAIADAKTNLNYWQLFTRGILCNVLVCLAVWLCMAARSVVGKITAIILPISAFVALGFEHSVANMYLLSIAALHDSATVSWWDLGYNLLPVTAGNIVGGSVLVALVYWLCYLQGRTNSTE